MKSPFSAARTGFTLVELLTVIAIIAILMGILLPTINSVMENAKKTQAKNDELQIVTAIKGYYTEYGKYPLLATEQGADIWFGENDPKTSVLMDVLRANGFNRDSLTGPNLNPRRIVFIEFPVAKNQTAGKSRSGIGADGQPYDPWGKPYIVRIDGSYDNAVPNPYSANAGFNGAVDVPVGVIVFSLGRDGKGGAGDKNVGDSKDDVISWQ